MSSRDLVVASNQELTREWWSSRRQEFELFASAVVIGEARDGDSELAARRVEILVGEVKLLEVTDPTLHLTAALLHRAGIPAKAEVDALHIALAAVHGMDYLLTWNCRHIANAFILPRVYGVCRDSGYRPPFVCTPQELMGG